MKRLLTTGLVVLISLLIDCSVFSIPTITKIPGNIAWTSIGYTLNIGDNIYIVSVGEISPNGVLKCDPNGVLNHPELQAKLCILKTSNHACLIGKIGINGEPFFVGTNFSLITNTAGELYLGINDTDLKNNSGEYSVTISIIKPKAISIDSTGKNT